MGYTTVTNAGNADIIPLGVITLFSGVDISPDWALCDGSPMDAVQYSGLFAVIGYTYGGANGTFLLPNLIDKFPIGANNNLGTVSGSATHTITEAELPSHTHNAVLNATSLGPGNTAPSNNATLCNTGAGGTSGAMYLATAGDATSLVPLNTMSVVLATTGSSTPIPIAPPSLAINYIIRVL